MTDKAEGLALIRDTLAMTEKQIADLESYFSVAILDAWPCVVALVQEGTGKTPTALKITSRERGEYNFSAMGRDAAQYSRAHADRIAADINSRTESDPFKRQVVVMPKAQFFRNALERAKETREYFLNVLKENA